ncbi:signal transduction histidine kinase [Variovorax boronicumulans]|uniref:ATP-binding protein n=1 Tax=Variovorax boronicumulans TaxID=436515 RepID=UPI00278A6D9C|nr:ATP-binding protein [Variovorax boronicumulans]MDQ0036776.1 signal transduction histidine kinase [Variovorax boronicumulans]
MRLSQFIRDNVEPILEEWETFARTMIPPAETMSVVELRDHAHEILLAIADEMESSQSEAEREAKSKGLAKPGIKATFAAVHGTLRQRVGFDLTQLSAEYRALRASVLRLWMAHIGEVDATVLEELMRFNEGIDQGLAEAMLTYSEHMASSRDTFLAVLGHDLRSPLGALSSCIHLLGHVVDGKPNERALRIARQSVASISEMITDLLEYTRTRLGRGIEVTPQAGNFSALCEEAFDQVCAAYPHRKLEVDIAPRVMMDFDASRMRQVLSNLLSNAVQHGDPAFPVAVEVRVDGDAAQLIVKNRGTPIPADSMQVIFNPLVQVASKESEPHERPATSLGLGLFIAREIVKGHGGTISVTSSESEGTSFVVRLPLSGSAGS